MNLLESALWLAGEVFFRLGLDRGPGTLGRRARGWTTVFEGSEDDAHRLAGRILKSHLPCGIHRTGPRRSEVVVRHEHREQAAASAETLGLDAQT
ncbi:MAG TPA: hypothetical protein VFI59_05720 [Actinomycetota bacterium]|nr:hypothetical protein [Actinomycetota bacterium]